MSELTFQVARITAENYRFRPPRRDAEDAVERADAFLAGAFLAATFFAGALFAGALFAGVFVATTFLSLDTFTMVALLYLIMTLFFTRVSTALERRLAVERR